MLMKCEKQQQQHRHLIKTL